MKKTLRNSLIAAAAAIGLTSCAAPAMAAPVYSFSSVSVNSLDWKDDAHKDYMFLEAEAGAGYKWGEVYGFVDLENIGKDTQAYFAKVTARVNMAKGVQAYFQFNDWNDGDFQTQNRVIGLGTEYSKGSFWIKPFAGVNQEQVTGQGARMNGYITGYVAGMSFGDKFSVTNWHETFISRKDDQKNGHNGAVAAWYHLDKTWTTGVQYRYATSNLGNEGFSKGIVYTIKANL